MKRRQADGPTQLSPGPVITTIPPAQVLSRLAAIPMAPIADLKQQWRELCGTEPPPYNRKFLESRLAYRIQELAYGGLRARPGRTLAI